MLTKTLFPTQKLPIYPVRFALGLLVLLLTLALLVTAVASENYFGKEQCDTIPDRALTNFSAETAVPDCWLIQ